MWSANKNLLLVATPEGNTVDGDSTVLRQYVWGDYIDELIQQREYNPYKPDKYHDHYLLTDIHYRSIALANEDGCLCEGYDTNAYGVTQIFDGLTGAAANSSPCAPTSSPAATTTPKPQESAATKTNPAEQDSTTTAPATTAQTSEDSSAAIRSDIRNEWDYTSIHH